MHGLLLSLALSPDYEEALTNNCGDRRLSEVGPGRNKDVLFFNMTGDSMMVYDVDSFTSPEHSELYVSIDSCGDFSTPAMNIPTQVPASVTSECSDYATPEAIGDEASCDNYSSDESTQSITVADFSKVWNDGEVDDFPLELSTLSQARQTPPPKQSFLRKRKSRVTKDSPSMPLYQSTPSQADLSNNGDSNKEALTVDSSPSEVIIELPTALADTLELNARNVCAAEEIPEPRTETPQNNDPQDDEATLMYQFLMKKYMESPVDVDRDDLLGADYADHYVRYKERQPLSDLDLDMVRLSELDHKMIDRSCGDMILPYDNLPKEPQFNAGKITDSVKLTKHRLSMPEYSTPYMTEPIQVNMALDEVATKPMLPELSHLKEIPSTRPAASCPVLASPQEKSASLPRRLNFGKEKLKAAKEKSSTLPPGSSLTGLSGIKTSTSKTTSRSKSSLRRTASLRPLTRHLSMLNPRLFLKKLSIRNLRRSKSKLIADYKPIIQPENYIQYLHKHDRLPQTVKRLMDHYQIFPDGKMEGRYSWYFDTHLSELVVPDVTPSIPEDEEVHSKEQEDTSVEPDEFTSAHPDEKNPLEEPAVKTTPPAPKPKRKIFPKRTQSEVKHGSKRLFKIRRTPTQMYEVPIPVSEATTSEKSDSHIEANSVLDKSDSAAKNPKRRSSIFRMFSFKRKNKTKAKHNNSEVSSVASSILQPDSTQDSAGLNDILASEDISTRTLRGDSDINSNMIASDQDDTTSAVPDKSIVTPEGKPSETSMDESFSLSLPKETPIGMYDSAFLDIIERIGLSPDVDTYVGVQQPSFSQASSKRCSVVTAEDSGTDAEYSAVNSSTLPSVKETFQESDVLPQSNADDIQSAMPVLPSAAKEGKEQEVTIESDAPDPNYEEIAYSAEIQQIINNEPITENSFAQVEDDGNTNQSANPYGESGMSLSEVMHAVESFISKVQEDPVDVTPKTNQGLLSPEYLEPSPRRNEDDDDEDVSSSWQEGTCGSYKLYHDTNEGEDLSLDTSEAQLYPYDDYRSAMKGNSPTKMMPDFSYEKPVMLSTSHGDSPMSSQLISDATVSSPASYGNKSAAFHRIYKSHSQNSSPHSKFQAQDDDHNNSSSAEVFYNKIYDDEDVPLLYTRSLPLNASNERWATGRNPHAKLEDKLNESDMQLQDLSGTSVDPPIVPIANQQQTKYQSNQSYRTNIFTANQSDVGAQNVDMSEANQSMALEDISFNLLDDLSRLLPGLSSEVSEGYDEVSEIVEGYGEVTEAVGYDEVDRNVDSCENPLPDEAQTSAETRSEETLEDITFPDDPENSMSNESSPNIDHLLSSTAQNAQEYYYTLGGLSPPTSPSLSPVYHGSNV